jgi:hypothetical protein
MRVPLGPRFQEERRRFAFRFACEDCVYFDQATPRCAHDYPTQPHRMAAFVDASNEVGESEKSPAMFCKEFEIV